MELNSNERTKCEHIPATPAENNFLNACFKIAHLFQNHAVIPFSTPESYPCISLNNKLLRNLGSQSFIWHSFCTDE